MDLAATGPLLARRYTGRFRRTLVCATRLGSQHPRAPAAGETLQLEGLKPRPPRCCSAMPSSWQTSRCMAWCCTSWDKDLAPIDALGLQPESINVTPRGLLVRFGACHCSESLLF